MTAQFDGAANRLFKACQKVLNHVGIAANADSATSGDSGKNTDNIRLRTEDAVCCDHRATRKPMWHGGHRYPHAGEAVFVSALRIPNSDVSDGLRYSYVGVNERQWPENSILPNKL